MGQNGGTLFLAGISWALVLSFGTFWTLYKDASLTLIHSLQKTAVPPPPAQPRFFQSQSVSRLQNRERHAASAHH